MRVETLIRLVAGVALLALAGCGSLDPTASPTGQDMAAINEDQLAEDLIRFARDPGLQTIAVIPFAQEVSLGLGNEILARRPAEELVEPQEWVIDAGPAGFRERVGPFSALDLLAQAGETVVSVGPHASCNTPEQPIPPPAAMVDVRRVSVQPEPGAVMACMQWWSVDLFITPMGEIAAVTLDFGAP